MASISSGTPVNKLTEAELLEELKVAVDRVNLIWANLPKRPYSLWIDWQHIPRRVVITDGMFIERSIIHP